MPSRATVVIDVTIGVAGIMGASCVGSTWSSPPQRIALSQILPAGSKTIPLIWLAPENPVEPLQHGAGRLVDLEGDVAAVGDLPELTGRRIERQTAGVLRDLRGERAENLAGGRVDRVDLVVAVSQDIDRRGGRVVEARGGVDLGRRSRLSCQSECGRVAPVVGDIA